MSENHYVEVNKNSPFPEAEAVQPIISSEQYSPQTGKKPHNTNAYTHWEEEEDKKLIEYFNQGLRNSEIASLLNRQIGGISSRIRKLGLREVKKVDKKSTNSVDIKACRKEIDRLAKMQSEIKRRIDDLHLQLEEMSKGMV